MQLENPTGVPGSGTNLSHQIRGEGLRCHPEPLLGGSWVVISGVISKVTIVITHFGEL